VDVSHYTIIANVLTSWVIEGSLDGWEWKMIDWQTANQDFKGGEHTASFAASASRECRFIRLTQTEPAHDGSDRLTLGAVEFFGSIRPAGGPRSKSDTRPK
jgi:hypothetical protein